MICCLTGQGAEGAAPFGKLRLLGRAAGPAGGLQAANGAAPLAILLGAFHPFYVYITTELNNQRYFTH